MRSPKEVIKELLENEEATYNTYLESINSNKFELVKAYENRLEEIREALNWIKRTK